MLTHYSNEQLALCNPFDLIDLAFQTENPQDLFWFEPVDNRHEGVCWLTEAERKISALLYDIDSRLEEYEGLFPELLWPNNCGVLPDDIMREYNLISKLSFIIFTFLNVNIVSRTELHEDTHMVFGPNGRVYKCLGYCEECIKRAQEEIQQDERGTHLSRAH